MGAVALIGTEFSQLHQGVPAKEIVRADDAEGALQLLSGGIDRVAGAPGLGAAGRRNKAPGQVLQGLIGVFHLDAVLKTAADDLPEGILQFPLDDKDHLAEAGQNGVVYRIINNDLTVGAQRVDLLQSAVTAAHTGSQNQKCRCLHPIPSITDFSSL